MKNTPLISICIPTFNREKYLDECLQSIFRQLNEENLDKIEIIISDNDSMDKTSNIVKKYSKIKKIRYYKNKNNIGLIKNIIRVGKYAKGKYLWFFSDDDIQTKQALNTVIRIINKNKIDVILCNLDECTKDVKRVKHVNSLGVNEDAIFHNRKELFKFLSGKFFYDVDWYTTFYSNLIIKKELFDKTEKLAKLRKNHDYFFPHSLGIYHSGVDYIIYLLSKRIVLRRSENTNWGPKGKKKSLLYWDKTLKEHYEKIVQANKDVIPLKFKFNLFMKRSIRLFRIYILLPVLHY